MKFYITLFLFTSFAILAQAQSDQSKAGKFGESISKKNAMPVTAIPEKLKSTATVDLKAKGTIVEVCQNKGCWMTLDMGNDETLRVTFKDYSFFVPKDAAGKTAWIEGIAKKETMSVAQLKHAAEDAGKPESEINAITTPKDGLSFVAKGVIIE